MVQSRIANKYQANRFGWLKVKFGFELVTPRTEGNAKAYLYKFLRHE
jgi:hypothetical protein